MGTMDAVTVRAMQALSFLMQKTPRGLRFEEIPKRVTKIRVPTSVWDVSCTIYRPPVWSPLPPPVYVNFHGGGFVFRHPEADDHICRYIAAHAQCVVVNVDYDVAPQRAFPVAATQAYDVTVWVTRHGEAQGWDGSRVAVGGHSAGGNLAAGVCLSARDRGEPSPLLQILDYPPLDLTVDPGDKRARTDKPLLTPGMGRLFDSSYVPDASRRADPLVSPLLADDLTGLAPALVITAEYDILRDEGDAYARALAAAGVPVTHRMVEGVDHAFTHRGPVEPALETIDLMATSLSAAFVSSASRPRA
jgi:acetyl esterase